MPAQTALSPFRAAEDRPAHSDRPSTKEEAAGSAAASNESAPRSGYTPESAMISRAVSRHPCFRNLRDAGRDSSRDQHPAKRGRIACGALQKRDPTDRAPQAGVSKFTELRAQV